MPSLLILICSDIFITQCLRDQFVRDVFKWGVVKTYSRFSRRITCIRWHPNYHDVVAFASYAGDIQLCYMSDPTRDIWVEGVRMLDIGNVEQVFVYFQMA